MDMEKEVNTLWIGNTLSTLQILCINSWLKNGFGFNLFVYEEVDNIPKGVNVLDANSILTKSKIFEYGSTGVIVNDRPFGEGSVAGFSDWFRVTLLYERGGIWIDMDVICLKPFETNEDYFFVEQDHPSKTLSIATCFMYVKEKHSKIFKEWLDRIEKMESENTLTDIAWGEIGPDMLSDIIIENSLYYYVENKNTFCPIDYTDYHRIFTENFDLNDSFGIHLWNSMWNQYDIDKEVKYSDTFIEKLKEKYLD